jgi:hypothetical protein
MLTPLLYLTQLGKKYLALKLQWEHDKAISRTRSRWEHAIRHPTAPAEKPQRQVVTEPRS